MNKKNNKLKVFWSRYFEGHGNFGDELSPYIIERLSGTTVFYVNVTLLTHSNWLALKVIFYKLLKRQYSIKSISGFGEWQSFSKQKIITAIGSIIKKYHTNNIIVWGSGIMSSKDFIHPADFKAVRGKYTQKRLQELGYKAPNILGDPALLLPLVYKPNKRTKSYRIGIIPHHIHYNTIKKHLTIPNVKFINLLDPIEKIIEDINDCQTTVSTSLHGIIVSHSYSIPSLWVSFNDVKHIPISGDNIKFKDYFSSVNLPMDNPYKINNLADWDTDKIYDKIENDENYLPKKEIITKIQRGLLKVAPFRIIEKYKTI